MSCIRRVSLIVNCGYARASIYNNSNPHRSGKHARQTIDIPKRLQQFKSQFSTYPNYGIPNGYFEANGRDGDSQFHRDCNKVLDGFQSKFRADIGLHRESYLHTFSLSKWSGLSNLEKNKHTLSNCARCYELHKDHQTAFPLKPHYQPEPVVLLNHEALQRQGVKKFTTNVLTELNREYSTGASTCTSFTEALLTTKSLGLERKKSKKERRQERTKLHKAVASKVNEYFAEKATLTLLTEGDSKRKYHRKRLAQSFTSPDQPQPKKKKNHSPNFDNVSWDTERLASTIENWPIGTPINWSVVGRDHGIEGGNAGQVAKEFAEAHEIDTTHIDTPHRKPTNRPSKRKLPGTRVAIPCNPPLNTIEAEINSMITSGRFTLGEECAPYKLTKFVPVSGKLTPQDIFIQARKVPLKHLRQKLLNKQLKYMRLTSVPEINDMTEEQIRAKLNRDTSLDCSSMSHQELCQQLTCLERSRSLCMWHDHATILKMGFIMITVHVLYDPAVFYTDSEYQQLHPETTIMNIQSEVEQPQIHLLSVGSSNVEDQAALVGDRISCLLELSTPVQTEDGTEIITDTLRFFTGDHPATQFEQGSKQGGTYKCAVCGCKESLFDEQSHSLYHKWRSLEHLQSLATGGIFGRQAGVLRPFDLKVRELRMELGARGVRTEGMLRADLQKSLDEVLRGVARVPALLLTSPSQSLPSLNLEKYEVVASEALHDIKGHIINLITELPHILPPGDTATKCTHLLDCCLAKEKKSGADLRRAVIQIFLLLKDLDCSPKILLLLQTIIIIGEISYSLDDRRSPRQLLRLYNSCWIHMELCRDLFSAPRKLTRSRMYGHYLHAITSHSPTQYELACLRSLNTENQERLFGQARSIAESCTNHHPDNVIPQIMLRMQAKQEQGVALASVQKGDSQVSHIAKELPSFPGTTVKTSFIKQREDSWQLHLQRISPFLVVGEDVWWTYTPNGFHFYDGDEDLSRQTGDFKLLHYRHHSLMDVEKRRETCWNRIITERLVIPANSIKLYNPQGKTTGQLVYHDRITEYIPADSSDTPTMVAQDSSSPAGIQEDTSHMEDCVGESLSHSLDDNQMQSVDGVEDSTQFIADMTHLNDIPSGSEESSSNDLRCPFLHLTPENHDKGLKTSLGNSIKKILGCDEWLLEFDDLRFQIKEARRSKKKHDNPTAISRYTELAAKIGTKVLSTQSKLNAELQQIEHHHFQQHSKLPTKTTNTNYSKTVKERNIATAILRNLNINL